MHEKARFKPTGRICAAVALAFAGASRAAQTRPRPVAVVPFHGRYCASMGSQGWAVTAENPQSFAFGAEFYSAGLKAAAGYSVFPAGAINPARGFTGAGAAVAATLSNMGMGKIAFGPRHQLAPNIYAVSFRFPQSEGMAYYIVFPVPGGEGDSEYNVRLEKEYCHDPATGQNYWVGPRSDWDRNGPQGPGYYTRNGNDVTKLQPGYSQ